MWDNNRWRNAVRSHGAGEVRLKSVSGVRNSGRGEVSPAHNLWSTDFSQPKAKSIWVKRGIT
jgi:hypothetical protein